ncbi:MAG TPA: RES family NAD+ phosphorylase, partial [Trueperaceae bacterium]|nr:RES family NAD+ phosphorylase [Trueperaceae bacterium]
QANRVWGLRLNVYRLTKRIYATPPSAAFSGRGSIDVSGRWNSRGRRMVYTSQSRALAALETVVHLERPQLLGAEYVIIPATVPDELIETVDLLALDVGWNNLTDLRATQKIGDAWLATGRSVALRVPTALIPSEFNVLLSPEHPDWPSVSIAEAESFSFDSRLS